MKDYKPVARHPTDRATATNAGGLLRTVIRNGSRVGAVLVDDGPAEEWQKCRRNRGETGTAYPRGYAYESIRLSFLAELCKFLETRVNL